MRSSDRRIVLSMIPFREISEGIRLGFSHRSANARQAPWPRPAGGGFRPCSLLPLPFPQRPCRIASWALFSNAATRHLVLSSLSPRPFPMPRSVTPNLATPSSPSGPKPATGRPRLLTTVTVAHGRAILHPTTSANAFVPVTISPVLPYLVAPPTQSGGRPNPSLQRTRYARR